MSDPAAPACRRCGQPLLEALTPDEVVTLAGQKVRFRRHTDFVMCGRCFALYRIGDLREGRIEPVSDEELLSAGDATREKPAGDDAG